MIYKVGILNLTPDSFSDGGAYIDTAAAISQLNLFASDGVDFVELGADSSRPGSICVTPQVEWSRLSKVLTANIDNVSISVDTHHIETMRQSIVAGAKMINDISGTLRDEVAKIVNSSGVKLVLMHNNYQLHDFSEPRHKKPEDIFKSIEGFFDTALSWGRQWGILSHLILDPGIGAFLSPDPKVSFGVLRRYKQYAEKYKMPLMLACSRKGFLRSALEGATSDPKRRDTISAITGYEISELCKSTGIDLYIRQHSCGSWCMQHT